MLDSTRIAHLQQSLRGELIHKGSPGYEHARALYNGMIDRYPALIACCRDVADVIAAVNFGRDHELVVLGMAIYYFSRAHSGGLV